MALFVIGIDAPGKTAVRIGEPEQGRWINRLPAFPAAAGGEAAAVIQLIDRNRYVIVRNLLAN
ncbi:hypothetical protein D3C81_2296010 [compost metagenome]